MNETEGSLTLRTLVVVRELASGDVVAQPVADVAAVSVGDEEVALLEQRAYLSSFLAEADAETVARFVLPEGARLAEVDVVLERPDLPRSLQSDVPIAIPCVVLPCPPVAMEPARGDAWVMVLPLAHTFYLPGGEDLDDAVRREVRRTLAVRGDDPAQWLALFPARDTSLEQVSVDVARGGSAPEGRSSKLRRRVVEHERRRLAAEVLTSVARPMHVAWSISREMARPLVARERELAQLSALLASKTRQSVALVGPGGSGKTALLRAAWEAGHLGGESRLVFSTSGAELLAGMSGLGQWQARVQRVMEAAETLDAIVYVEDLGDLLAEHGGHGIDLAAGLLPFLEDGRVRLVGELVDTRVDWADARAPAFFSALVKLPVPACSRADAERAVRAHVEFDARRYPDQPTLDPAGITALTDLAERYLPYRAFPAKVVSLYRELLASRVARSSPGEASGPVPISDLYRAFSVRTGVPEFLLDQRTPLGVDDVASALRRRVVGQDEAVLRLAELVCVVKARLAPPDKPLATLLFVGPTGVGKTELARALAAYLFGGVDRIVRLDMGEYADVGSGDRLFRGTSRDAGTLTQKVQEQPFCVVLLDEIEKADPSVFDLLLQVCGEGRLTDARGQTVHFQNTIIVLTSNLGASHGASSLGFGASSRPPADAHAGAIERAFRPELLNRFDRIISFRPLSRADARQVLDLSVSRAFARRGFADLGVSVELSEAARTLLTDDAFSSVYGARAVRRHVERALVEPAAGLLAAAGRLARDAALRVDVATQPDADMASGAEHVGAIVRDGLALTLERRTGRRSQSDARGMDGVSRIRRELSSWLALDAVVSLRASVRFLVVQLAQASAPKKRKMAGAEVASLSTAHHRLSSIEAQLVTAFDDVRVVEELAMDALLQGGSLDGFEDEAVACRARFRKSLVRALVAEETTRDAVTLMATEGPVPGAFDLWLLPLFDAAAARGWKIELRFDADPPAGSPAGRRWSDPRTPEQLRARLAQHRPRSVLLSVRGDHAGILLGLEGGLHKWRHVSPDAVEVLMLLRVVAFRASLTHEELADQRLQPVVPALFGEASRVVPTRDVDGRTDTVTIVSREVSLPIPHSRYFSELDEIALEHLLLNLRNPAADVAFDPSPIFTSTSDGER